MIKVPQNASRPNVLSEPKQSKPNPFLAGILGPLNQSKTSQKISTIPDSRVLNKSKQGLSLMEDSAEKPALK